MALRGHVDGHRLAVVDIEAECPFESRAEAVTEITRRS